MSTASARQPKNGQTVNDVYLAGILCGLVHAHSLVELGGETIVGVLCDDMGYPFERIRTFVEEYGTLVEEGAVLHPPLRDDLLAVLAQRIKEYEAA